MKGLEFQLPLVQKVPLFVKHSKGPIGGRDCLGEAGAVFETSYWRGAPPSPSLNLSGVGLGVQIEQHTTRAKGTVDLPKGVNDALAGHSSYGMREDRDVVGSLG